ncbi:hypothetical protein PHAVU_003G121800 [Phaseolus vulgaris]|uniref:Uncharacterized protein n=1 Tax=Phaseolus vulgaris TaxID=3885 RepID=V7CAT3_PHAVU|nr:hypothetical protein PHAVU_003G121800g [Phaseolus vulgaris]ESW26463.1 hypothetical protein PHAVU_003G121800g [Phaseolus vulgaris]
MVYEVLVETVYKFIDIKLIRTDTTLDLSQKAEKGMSIQFQSSPFYNNLYSNSCITLAMWDLLIAVLRHARYVE